MPAEDTRAGRSGPERRTEQGICGQLPSSPAPARSMSGASLEGLTNMADAEAFDFVCDHLEQNTMLDRLVARGTVRIALKEAGLEARTVSPDQMSVVAEKVLPAELNSRGIEDAEGICAAIKRGLDSLDSGAGADTPDAVFKRLGGG